MGLVDRGYREGSERHGPNERFTFYHDSLTLNLTRHWAIAFQKSLSDTLLDAVDYYMSVADQLNNDMDRMDELFPADDCKAPDPNYFKRRKRIRDLSEGVRASNLKRKPPEPPSPVQKDEVDQFIDEILDFEDYVQNLPTPVENSAELHELYLKHFYEQPSYLKSLDFAGTEVSVASQSHDYSDGRLHDLFLFAHDNDISVQNAIRRALVAYSIASQRAEIDTFFQIDI